MTHEPEQISIARQAWIEEVSKMSPAEKDGAIQGVIDAGFALGLVVVPKERVTTLNTRFDDDDGVFLGMGIKEYHASQMLQAAQALAQLAISADAVVRTERRFAGRREIRYTLAVVLPAVNSGESLA